MMPLSNLTKNALAACCTAALLVSCASTAQTVRQPGRTPAEIRSRIQRTIDDADLAGASIGVNVVYLKTGEPLFQSAQDHLLIPASNTKLLTAVGALKALGSDFRFTTDVLLDSSFVVVADTLVSNIYIRGGGDPELDSKALQAMASQLARFGTSHIKGDIVADESWFDDVRLGPGWMWDDVQYDYSAQISALSINRNAVMVAAAPGDTAGAPVRISFDPATSYIDPEVTAVTVSPDTPDSLRIPLRIHRRWRERSNVISVTGQLPADADTVKVVRSVEAPGLYAATLMKEQLSELGISISGSVRLGETASTAVNVARHNSDPLPSALAFMLKDSDNLASELLIKTMGAHVDGPPGSIASGL